MSSSTHRWLWLLIALGLGLRLVAAYGLQTLLDDRWHREFLILGDASGYWELGERLARGDEYRLHDPPRFALRTPGFPVVLALSIKLFGNNKFAARLLLSVLCTAAIGINFRLGQRLHSDCAGLIAAGLTAISPVFVAFSPVLLCESAFAVSLLLTLLVAAELLADVPTRSATTLVLLALSIGVTSALAVYIKPSWILAVPVFAIYVSCNLRTRTGWRYSITLGALVVFGMWLTLLPWGLRNQRVTGHFTLTTLWMGPSLYDGLNPQATGDSEMTFFERDGLTATLSEYEVDQHYRHAAREYAMTHPNRVLQLAVMKFLRYWSPWPNAEQFDHWSAKIATSSAYIPCLILAMFGAWRERRNGTLLLLTLGPILYFCALHCIFVASLRYRLPGEYPLMVLSAIGAKHFRDRCCPAQGCGGPR